MTDHPQQKSRTAPAEQRRRELIEATIASIGEHGISGTTLTTVTRRAGVSIGLVNFHFEGKEGLLAATLRHLAEEHRDMWRGRAAQVGLDPVGKIYAILDAQFHPSICNPEKLAVWFAFFGNPAYRRAYRATTTGIDDERIEVVTGLCAEIIETGGYRGIEPRGVAATLEGLFDGFWLNILMYPESFTAQGAKAQVFAYLATIFPGAFGGDQVSG